MSRGDRVCYGLALILFTSALWSALPPLVPGRADDWVYAWPLSPTMRWLALASVAVLLPSLVRFVRRFRLWLVGLAVTAVFGLFVAVSIPGLLRARMSVGGLATGGAKDVEVFRSAIRNGYLPHATDITYEGLFYDYMFDTMDDGHAEPQGGADALLRPVYSWARRRDPLTGTDETFLAVGLRSGADTSKIARKRLNLAVVLDISGSMSAPLDTYHYDRARKGAGEPNASKLQTATHAIVAMMDQLHADDRLAVVLFDHQAYLAKPFRTVAATDMPAIKRHVLALGPRGGTSMEAGLEKGRALFEGLEAAGPDEVENRILFLTDAMPNAGRTDGGDLASLTERYAREGIHCTFLGVGVDFQTELVERLTRVRGANYYAIHSADDFARRLDREFDYMVTPWAYDFSLQMTSAAYFIEAVYGAPEAGRATGQLMRVETLFPSPSQDGGVRGGILLLKLRPTGSLGDVQLAASYEDRQGRRHEVVTQVAAPAADAEGSRDVRKAVLLTRYGRLMREWLEQERGEGAGPVYSWERTSQPLRLSPTMKKRVRRFHEHFRAEAQAIGDAALVREDDILSALSGLPSSADGLRAVARDEPGADGVPIDVMEEGVGEQDVQQGQPRGGGQRPHRRRGAGDDGA